MRKSSHLNSTFSILSQDQLRGITGGLGDRPNPTSMAHDPGANRGRERLILKFYPYGMGK